MSSARPAASSISTRWTSWRGAPATTATSPAKACSRGCSRSSRASDWSCAWGSTRAAWAALLGVATVGLISASAWQLLPGSRFLKELAQGGLPKNVEYYTIAAQRDWVCPPSSTPLDGAESLVVPLGHSSLVMSEEVYRHILWALRKERPRSP